MRREERKAESGRVREALCAPDRFLPWQTGEEEAPGPPETPRHPRLTEQGVPAGALTIC